MSKHLAAKAVVVKKRNTKGMTASAKGAVREPGQNVRQKAGLSRVTGWGGLERMLGYKVGERIEFDAASRTCSECGVVSSASRPPQAESVCVACGHVRNADTAPNHSGLGHWGFCRARR